MSVSSPLALTQRHIENQNLAQLTNKFKEYNDQVRNMREHCKKTENNVFLAQIHALDTEISELTAVYTRELESVKSQLESCIAERNALHLECTKNSAMLKELQEKFGDEKNTRLKLEGGLADAHRLCGEKDQLIQELRITIAQHQNAHLDTTKEKDEYLAQLTDLRMKHDQEAKMRIDLEATVQKLSEQIIFEREIHEKDAIDLKNRNAAAERTIEIADDKLRAQDNVADKLQQQVEDIKRQTQQEFLKYQETCENAYQLQFQDHKADLEKEGEGHAQAKEQIIQLKAIIEEMNTKIQKLDSKCNSYHDQNTNLIHTLEVERRQAAATCHELEKRLHELKEKYDTKVRELNVANSINIPYDLELDALSSVIDAETKRLSTFTDNPSSELVANHRGELISSRSHYAHNAAGSPRRRQSAVATPLSRRQKSPSAGQQENRGTELPPLTAGKFPSIFDQSKQGQTKAYYYDK